MVIGNVFDRYTFDDSRAQAYGFVLNDGVYTLRKPLSEEGFYAVYSAAEDRFEVNVFEEPDGEPFLPFNVKDVEGGFVGAVRQETEQLTQEILENCFTLTDVKALLIDHVRRKYGTIPEAPWGALEQYHTLNTAKRHKWYGLFMLIPYKYLGVEKEGRIHVLNLKIRTEDIPAVVDHVHFFPAYHMNKKYWISVLLDRDVNIERVKHLLDESYALVENAK